MRFLDVRTDYAFKRVFGSEQSIPILQSFLNAVLEYPPEREIVELVIVDPYQVPLLKGMKDTYVDVKALLKDGRRVIIEMQVLNVEGFEKRILYNAAKTYSQQLMKGEDYTLLNPVIALTLTDFTLFPTAADMISRFKLLEKQRYIEYIDDIELVFIELPKFNKDESQLADIQDQWLYFVKNAGSLAAVPTVMGENPVFRKAFEIANTANLSEAELEAQDKRHDLILLQRGALALAEKRGMQSGLEKGMEQGLEQGMEKGMEKGIQQERLRIAIALLTSGMEKAQVMKATGLSEMELRQAQDSNI